MSIVVLKYELSLFGHQSSNTHTNICQNYLKYYNLNCQIHFDQSTGNHYWPRPSRFEMLCCHTSGRRGENSTPRKNILKSKI